MNTGYYNQALYKDGKGLLPAPLGVDAELAAGARSRRAGPGADATIRSFPSSQSETNPLIRGVKIDRYRKVADGWKPGQPSSRSKSSPARATRARW